MKQNKEKDIIEALMEICKDKTSLKFFLEDLLTPSEYIEIKKRWEIVKMLYAGVNQHQIAKDLQVGIATVTRGSRALRDSKGGFNVVLNKKDHLKK